MRFAAIFLLPLSLASPTAAQAFSPDSKDAFVAAALDGNSQAIVSGMNRFGLDLYGRVRSGNKDLMISPASLSTAFGLAYAGARGRTANEIAAVLHYPAVADFHDSFGTLLRTMNLHQNGRTLTVNNAIWLQDSVVVNPDYAALVERDYRAGLQRVDFRSNAEMALQTINHWVESKTNDRIRDIFTSAEVNKDTRSVLVNTVYFKADWARPFYKGATKPEEFTLASGRKVKRALMHQEADFAFAEQAGVKALAMPYRGEETDMILLLPDKPSGLGALEHSLDTSALNRWLAKLDGRQSLVVLTLPKFKIEDRFELTPALKAMGMQSPFTDYGDFSGMKVFKPGSPKPDDWNFKVDSVVQQVFVDVEETGTEAAAATGGIMISGSRLLRPIPKPVEFRADHPFLFLIRDRRTKAVLFIGRFTGEGA